MSGWIGVGLVSAIALGAGFFLLRNRRNLWTLLAAVVVFGLAGYAWQGSPGYPAAPAAEKQEQSGADATMVDLRREFFAPSDLPSHFVTVADGFARQGNYQRASQLLQGVVSENPEDGEAWLALGIALVEYGGGRVTKPAEYALSRASQELPGNPGPAFFIGVNALRGGDLAETRALWVKGLQDSKPDAEGREFVAERLLGLDRLIQALEAQRQGGSGASSGTPSAPVPQQ